MKKRIISAVLVTTLLLALLAGCTGNGGGVSSTTEPVSRDLPDYTAGQITKLQYDEGTTLTHSVGSTYAQFEKYCADMDISGYGKLFERDTQDLRCAAFEVENDYVYAYYAKHTREARVVRGPKGTFSAGDCRENTGVTATPTLTMIGQPLSKNNGLGIVFVLPDGRLIIYDGGFGYTTDDPEAIYSAIRSVAPDKDNIVIAGWFLSHPHDDHVSAFMKFVKNHGADEDIRIQRVIFNFAEAGWYDFQREDGGKEHWSQYVLDTLALCRDQLPDAQMIKAHSGQIFDFGEADVEILYTVEDLLPGENLGYVNSSSMVVRVTIAGQSVLLLGDSTSYTSTILEGMYGESLRSDMVQLAHHGMWAGTETLYFYVGAPVLLWPTLPSVAVQWLADHPALSAIKQAKDIYIAGSENTTLQLPYEVIKNKEPVLKELNQFR